MFRGPFCVVENGMADRGLNFYLRLRGIGAVEKDFKTVSTAGTKSFAEVKKAANGAALEVSDYTARLKRAAAAAKADFANIPQLHKGNAATVQQNRSEFILTRVGLEQKRILEGKEDLTLLANGARDADAAMGAATRRAALLSAGIIALGFAIKEGAQFVSESVQAYEEHERLLAKFDATLRLTGIQAVASGSQIEEMATQVKESSLQTKEATLSAAASLATVPALTSEMLEEALDVSARLADALGTDVQQEAERTGQILRAVADEDVEALYKATEGMSAQFRLSVIELIDMGKQAEAQALVLAELARIAGDGPGGVTAATDTMTDAWDRFKLSVGEYFADAAVSSIRSITSAFDGMQRVVDFFNTNNQGKAPTGADAEYLNRSGRNGLFGVISQSGIDLIAPALLEAKSLSERAAQKKLDARFNAPKRRRSAARTPRKDNSAEREADRLKRETERARAAADKVIESNDDAIASYRLRAEEAQARLGKEDDALEAVVRQQTIDAAARTISRDLIEKEVEARRLSEKANFDEAAVRAEATAKVDAQTDAIREQAAAYYDAEKAQADFTRRMTEAKALADQVATPLERVTGEVERLAEMLNHGDITADHFNRRMDQLANDLVNQAERAGNAWQGFGDDVGATFSDIILNGGTAREILQELIRLPLERLLFQNVQRPVADFVDGLTGNNRNDNVADARAQLDTIAISGANQQLLLLELASRQAAFALSSIQPAAQQGVIIPFGEAGASATGATEGLNTLPPATAQAGTAVAQFLAQLAGAGSGAGGFLSSVLSIGAAAFGGGGVTAGSTAALSGASSGLINANPGIFHEGGEIGMPGRTKRLQFGASASYQFMQRRQIEPDERLGIFQTGERILSRSQNRALTSLLRGGGRSPPRGRLAAGGGHTTVINNNINAPLRMDPRRTAHGLARTTQAALARANSKGLAAGPPRRGS